MNSNSLFIVALVIVVVVLAVIFGQGTLSRFSGVALTPVPTPTSGLNGTITPVNTLTPQVVLSPPQLTPAPTGPLKKFTVTASNYQFTPNKITVKKGDNIQITLNNQGGTHDFVIDEFNVASNQLSGGDNDLVTFVADKTGTYEFYCSIDGHRQMGMVGTLTVQ